MHAPAIHPDVVRDAIARRGIKKKELAERTGLNVNSLTPIETEGWDPRWSTLKKLCEAAQAITAERA